MEDETYNPLRQLAYLAGRDHLRGGSFKRNALLKPFDIILELLDGCIHPQDPGEIMLLRAAAKNDIMVYFERIAPEEYIPGRTKASKVNDYVDLFFDEVLGQMHHGQVSQLLARQRILRSAYLTWMRQSLDELQEERKAASALAGTMTNESKPVNNEEPHS